MTGLLATMFVTFGPHDLSSMKNNSQTLFFHEATLQNMVAEIFWHSSLVNTIAAFKAN